MKRKTELFEYYDRYEYHDVQAFKAAHKINWESVDMNLLNEDSTINWNEIDPSNNDWISLDDSF